jgi:hypothetical protein
VERRPGRVRFARIFALVSGWLVLALAVSAWAYLPAAATELPMLRETWYLLLAVALVRALYGTYRFVQTRR